jgi:hypothetical protein
MREEKKMIRSPREARRRDAHCEDINRMRMREEKKMTAPLTQQQESEGWMMRDTLTVEGMRGSEGSS